jgi:hypothetical protein
VKGSGEGGVRWGEEGDLHSEVLQEPRVALRAQHPPYAAPHVRQQHHLPRARAHNVCGHAEDSGTEFSVVNELRYPWWGRGSHQEQGLDKSDGGGPKSDEIAKHVEDAEDLGKRARRL